MKKIDFSKSKETLANAWQKTADVSKGAFSTAWQKTSDVSKKVASGVKEGAINLSEKAKIDSYARRMKKYNPLFPDKYFSEEFNLPNMVVIVDEAPRRDIDVCEGAIGWIGNESGIEVLYLYDEAVKESGLQFVPKVDCDTVYYVDSFDRKKFINVDVIFSKAHEEKIAELKHVAYSLGAKKCIIEISESEKESGYSNKSEEVKGNAKGVKVDESVEIERNQNNLKKVKGRDVMVLEGNNVPNRPTLKWFMHYDNINRLIEMRCSDPNSIKSDSLELEGSYSMAISRKTAVSIDNAIRGMQFKGETNFEQRAIKESNTSMTFIVEF